MTYEISGGANGTYIGKAMATMRDKHGDKTDGSDATNAEVHADH